MAQVTASEASGLLKSLYGQVQGPIVSIIKERSEQYERESIANILFAKRKSTHAAEGYGGITGIDSWAPVGENGAHPTGGFEEDFNKFIQNVTWKGSMSISRELMDDSQVKNITNRPDGLVRNYHRERERFFARLLGEAIKANTSFTINGHQYLTTGADEVCVFSKAHPAKVKGPAQSNLYAGAFDADNLFKLMTAMQNAKDSDGNTLDLCPTHIVIPNVATLKSDVYKAVGSVLDPASANNAINVVGGSLEVITWSYLNDFIAPNTLPFIIFDKNYNDMYDGNVMQDRVEVEYKDCVGANDEYIWKGYARFSGGFVDWRQMFLGGITGGTAL